jgi:hypothetical protein
MPEKELKVAPAPAPEAVKSAEPVFEEKQKK